LFRRALQFASLICLAGLCLFYPLLESLDPWDSPEPASDAEIQFIALLTFVGVMFVLAHLLATLAVILLMQLVPYLLQRASATLELLVQVLEPLLTASPPLLLRI
jgi:amino acid transporter